MGHIHTSWEWRGTRTRKMEYSLRPLGRCAFFFLNFFPPLIGDCAKKNMCELIFRWSFCCWWWLRRLRLRFKSKANSIKNNTLKFGRWAMTIIISLEVDLSVEIYSDCVAIYKLKAVCLSVIFFRSPDETNPQYTHGSKAVKSNFC